MVLGADMYLVLSPDPCATGDRAPDYQLSDDEDPESTRLPMITIEMALDVLWHDKKHATDMKKIMLAIISFSMFVAAMFLHISTTHMFHQSYGISSTLATSGSDTITDNSPTKFYNIETVPDIFDWLNNTFIPQVFVTEDYNGNALPENQWGRVATFNKVLGAVHFETTYMQEDKCGTPDVIIDLFPTCFDSSSTITDEFLVNFDTNASEAAALINEKKESGNWIDASTQQVIITVITLNAELPGYAVTKLQLDFNGGGFVEPTGSTTPTLVDQYPSTTTIVLDILVVVWFSPWILFPAIFSFARSYEKKHRLATPKQWMKLAKHTAKAIGVWAFPDGWFAIDFFRGPIVYAFYITVLITQAVTTDSEFQRKLVALGDSNQTTTETRDNFASVTKSFRTIANLTVLLRLLATAAVLVLGLRILNTFRDHVGLSILTRTMASALHTFWTFSVIFVVIFVAFAACGTVLFGDRVAEFSSLLSAMKSCVNMIYGDFDFGSIQGIDYSVAYYWSYMTLETFVLLNIVLAIVIDAYQEEKNKKDKNKCWVFRRVICNVFREWLARVNDLLWCLCCRVGNRRHYIVFWGKIRSRVLHDTLLAKLEELQTNDEYSEWSSKTILSVKTLNTLFPDARDRDCEATLVHLAVEQLHQSSHDVIKTKPEPENEESIPKHENIQSAKTPVDISDDTVTSSTGIHSRVMDELHVLEMNQLHERIDTLEHKLDFLIANLVKNTV